MSRLLTAALAVLTASPAFAQSDLSPSSFALGASGSYAGVVSSSRYQDLDGFRAPGTSLDVSYGRLSLGAGLSFYQDATPVEVAAGVHLLRNAEAQRATTLGVRLITDLPAGGGRFTAWTLGHQERVYGRPGFALVPSGAVGFTIGTTEYGNRVGSPIALAQLGAVIGSGPARVVVAPSVGWSGGDVRSVSVGLSAGVARSLGRR